jgi:hypothetical protein
MKRDRCGNLKQYVENGPRYAEAWIQIHILAATKTALI